MLWARAIGGPGAARIVAPLIGLSPFLLQNASYPWSKMVAAGLVLLFLLLIRAAALARRPSRARQTFVLAALCAGLGYLAHQTTIFYVLPTLLWLAWRRPRPLFRRPVAWTLTTWALGGLAGLAAFGPWQAWVISTYGLRRRAGRQSGLVRRRRLGDVRRLAAQGGRGGRRDAGAAARP